MYAEITKVKQLTISQYDNDVQLYFDAIKFSCSPGSKKSPCHNHLLLVVLPSSQSAFLHDCSCCGSSHAVSALVGHDCGGLLLRR
jgi:hypothetical protein